jgi:hypothetical protein
MGHVMKLVEAAVVVSCLERWDGRRICRSAKKGKEMGA